MKFDWDQGRAKVNLRRHHVSFDEAATVFMDPMAVSGTDPDHSLEEDRYITFGLSRPGALAGRVPYLSPWCDSNHQCTSRNAR